MNFDATFPLQFYINLNRRDDRRRKVLNGFLDAGLERVARFPAIDSRRVGNSRGHWSAGRYALALTQKLCVREARRRGAPAVMLFEDDVVLHPEFQQRMAQLELPEDWGLFYLGVQHTEPPVYVSPGIVKIPFGLDTHAVAVNARYYQRVMQVLSPQGKGGGQSIKPSDWLLAGLHGEIPTYAAFPNLAWQGQEDVSDLMGKWNGTYDHRGFQNSNRHLCEEVLRRHLGLRHWREAVPDRERCAKGKVAFLFLTRGRLVLEDVWSEYFVGNEDRVAIYAHPKADDGAGPQWWREAVLPEREDHTAWADVSLVRAQRRLLAAAMQDESNEAFVFLSETCVPIKPFPALLAHLDRTDWRGMMDCESHAAVAERDPKKGRRLDSVADVPAQMWRYHSQWMLLTRDMAAALLSADITDRWRNSFVPDETLFGTQLALMGYPLAKGTLPTSPTWTRWAKSHGGHPESFGDVDEALLCALLAAPQFFARKFTAGSNMGDFGLHLAAGESAQGVPAGLE